MLALALAALSWSAWSPDALERARREDKPVLLLLSVPTCAACAAAEDDVFSGSELAALADARFVPIRVDRVERPGLADAYLAGAGQLSTAIAPPDDEPLVVVTTADGWPLAWAPVRAGGAAVVASRLAEVIAQRPDLTAKAGVALAQLREAQGPVMPRVPLARHVVARAIAGAGSRFSFGSLRLAASVPRAESASALPRLLDALDAIAAGPRRDRGSGGFRHEGAAGPRSDLRLDENAQLLRAFATAAAASGRAPESDAAAGIASFLQGSLADAEGGFRAALDGSVRDERVCAAENGLAIGALALSGAALRRPADVSAAQVAAAAVLARLGPPAALKRCVRGPAAEGVADLDDYAFLAEGLLDLDDARPDERWRKAAAALVDAALVRFSDERGGFDATERAEGLIVRMRDGFDGARPSANGVLASVLLRLARATGERRYVDLARRTVESFAAALQQAPSGVETLASAAAQVLPASAGPEVTAAPARRVARGPVTVEAVAPAAPAPGASLEVPVRMTIAAGWTVSAHRPEAKGLVGLTVSVLGDESPAAAPRYPEGASTPINVGEPPARMYVGDVVIVVPVSPARGAADAGRDLRLAVRYQPCRHGRCQEPERVIVAVPAAASGSR